MTRIDHSKTPIYSMRKPYIKPWPNAGVLSTKLDEMPETIETALAGNETSLARLLAPQGEDRWIAVGSGGSWIAAYHFMYMLNSLGRSCSVYTPLQLASFVQDELAGKPVAVFSATGRSPDTLAAVYAARRLKASKIVVITLNEELADDAAYEGAEIALIDGVEDFKDGFLATHSLVATSIAVMRALGGDERDKGWTDLYAEQYGKYLASSPFIEHGRDSYRQMWRGYMEWLTAQTRLFVIWEPMPNAHPGIIMPMLHTYITEAGLCHFTSDDARRFAHGKHSVLFSREGKSFVLTLGTANGAAFRGMSGILRRELPANRLVHHTCANMRNPTGMTLEILQGLVMIEAMGYNVGIDPGKPNNICGAGRDMYYDNSFRDEQRELMERSLK